jgi:hypothetical protein
MLTPFSINYDLDIHMAVNVPKLLKIDPPIQVKNFLYTGPTTLVWVPAGTSFYNSFLSLWGVPGNIVEPPLNTIFSYKSFLTSKSHFIMDW